MAIFLSSRLVYLKEQMLTKEKDLRYENRSYCWSYFFLFVFSAQFLNKLSDVSLNKFS